VIDDGFQPPNLGIQHTLPVGGERKVATPLVVLVGGRPLVDSTIKSIFRLRKSISAAGKRRTCPSVRSATSHDAVAMPGSVSHRQRDVENLGFGGTSGSTLLNIQAWEPRRSTARRHGPNLV
jgi:hypothetical protein